MNKSTFDIKRFFTQSYYTVEPLYSGQILLKLGESRSNSYKKPLYSGQFIADTRYNGHVFPRLWRKINLYSGQFGNLFKTIRENNEQSIQSTGMLFTHNFLLKITENCIGLKYYQIQGTIFEMKYRF